METSVHEFVRCLSLREKLQSRAIMKVTSAGKSISPIELSLNRIEPTGRKRC